MKKKFFILMLVIIVCFSATAFASLEGPAEKQDRPVIGIAWLSNYDDGFYQFWERTIWEAGGYPVFLPLVKFSEDWYTDYNVIANNFTEANGELSLKCAKKIKSLGWRHSNVKEVMKGIDAVFFPGGESISTTLYANPQKPIPIEVCNPTRDVSDYLLMSYCIEIDKPIFCVCRNMQMLGIINGADVIQSIPEFCTKNEIKNLDTHRVIIDKYDLDFTWHDISITDKKSLLYEIAGNDTIQNAPSCHVQAIIPSKNSPLKIVATHTDKAGLTIVEAIEMPSKAFVLGTQFHPEYICSLVLKDRREVNSILCDYKICLRFWQKLVDVAKECRNKEK